MPSSATYCNKSPGWQSSALQISFKVERRIAFALLFFKMDRFARVKSISPASSVRPFLRIAIMTSKLIIIAIVISISFPYRIRKLLLTYFPLDFVKRLLVSSVSKTNVCFQVNPKRIYFCAKFFMCLLDRQVILQLIRYGLIKNACQHFAEQSRDHKDQNDDEHGRRQINK